jgi:hypothetical protein
MLRQTLSTAMVLAALVASPLPGQDLGPARDTIVPSSVTLRVAGKTVEVIGLRRWTIAMLQDSMAKYAPGEALTSHACAAILRYKLGFADAAAVSYAPWPGDSVERVVVSVVEPQDSARVRYRAASFDSTTPHRPWAEAIAIVARHPVAIHAAVEMYDAWRRAPQTSVPAWAARDSTSVREYVRFLAAHAAVADYRTAQRLLLTSRDYRTRIVAATVLGNFLDRDPAVHTLLLAVIERDGVVRDIAGQVLSTLLRARRRPVRWTPAASTVHAILDGTNLFSLRPVMELLVATSAGPADAPGFLHGGGAMLLAYLGARQPDLNTTARRLLITLRGRDLGPDPARWREWIATL